MPSTTLIAVGGDPEASDRSAGSATYSLNGGVSWKVPRRRQPASAAAFDGDSGRFIEIGPDGTVDDGPIGEPLTPVAGEPADADKGWVAVSLPFVVGHQERIGRLDDPPLTITAKRQK
jgi:hypothetical protein